MLILLLIFLFLHLLPFFGNPAYFWGFDSFFYLSPFLGVISLILIVFSFTNLFQQKFKTSLDSFFNLNSKIRYFILLTFSLVIFYSLSTGTYFLGDGYLRIRNLEGGIFFSTQEPFDTFLHQIIYHSFKHLLGLTPEATYVLISILSGVLTIFFILKFIDLLKNDNITKGLLFLIFLTITTNQIFFGYVESYSFFTMLLTAYSYFAYRFIIENRYLQLLSIIFTFLILTHTLGLLIIPSYIYLLYLCFKRNKTKIIFPIILVIFFITMNIVLMALYTGENILEKFQTTASQRIFLPFLSDANTNGILSLFHFLDVFNQLILVFPLVIILFPIYKFLKFSETNIFYLIATIPFLLFLITIKANLGFARDWDLFSIYGIPMFFLIAILLIKSEQLKNKLIYPIIIAGLIHSASFIIVNSSEINSVIRAENLASTAYWSNQSKALLYDELAQYYKKKGNLDKSVELTNRAYQFEKNPRYLYRNAVIYLSQKNNSQSEFYLKELAKTDYAKGEVFNLLADLYYDMENYDSALVYYNKNLKIEPNNFLALNNIGIIMMNQSKFGDAIDYFNKSLKINPQDSYVYYYIAICYFNNKNYEAAKHYAKLSEKYGYKQSVINSFLSEINRRLGLK